MVQPVTIDGLVWHEFIEEAAPNKEGDSYLFKIAEQLANDQTFAKIKQARLLQGGWETWAQVECAIALKPTFPEILREQPIYANSVDRIDLWAQEPTKVASGIEMKCRNKNFGSEFALDGLPEQMITDIVKVGGALKAGYPATRVMYAIGITGNPLDCLWQKRDKNGNVVGPYAWAKSASTVSGLAPGPTTRLKFCRIAGTTDIQQDLVWWFGGKNDWQNLYLVWYKISF